MNNQQILVGVCGGVAAYKALDVISALRKQGHTVCVAMTPSATHFVSPLTFAAVSGQPVLTDLIPSGESGSLEDQYPHLYPATRCDLFVLLPATANSIARLAHGLGDDVVSCSALSLPAKCRRIFCPSMNVEMWEQGVVQENVSRLETAGWERIGPAAGHLACGMTGVGRLASAEEILNALDKQRDADPLNLHNKKVLILSGPTREHLDPVRYIGNPSSGKMGQAIADTAAAAGADVQFVTGPVPGNHLPNSTVQVQKVISAEDMLAAGRQHAGSADIIIYVAAVADYRPIQSESTKRPKSAGNISLELTATPDIAATLCADKHPDQVAIGFALQTENGERYAIDKLKRKNLDGIVLNYTDSLGADDGNFTFIRRNRNGETDATNWGRLDKTVCARRILIAARDLSPS